MAPEEPDVFPDPPETITAPFEVYEDAGVLVIRDSRSLRVIDIYECAEMMNTLYERDNPALDETESE